MTPQSDSPSMAATPVPSRTPPSLSLPGSTPAPVPLEDLSPDSIDAQTFDFETIGHPGLDPALQQGSLDLDSLAESPESDFMSAVNEFVIEENPASPNSVSDPVSPEMMVESLYSSVINAIDSRRMQDTATLQPESSQVAALNQVVEKFRRAAKESRSGLTGVKLDLDRLRALQFQEQQDMDLALRGVTSKLQSGCEALQRRHESELQSVRTQLEVKLRSLEEENQLNQNLVRDLQRALLDLEGSMERKEKDLSELEQERERWADADRGRSLRIQDLEQTASRQAEEAEQLAACRERLSGQLEALRVEMEQSEQRIRQELKDAAEQHLQKVQQEHRAELDLLHQETQDALQTAADQHRLQLSEEADCHAAALSDTNQQLAELRERLAFLTELRCKLEVELALKESESEELRRLVEEVQQQRGEAQQETGVLSEQLVELKQCLQLKNEEYEGDLAELRSLLRVEKDHCISELVERHDEEILLLKKQLASLQKEKQDAQRSHDQQQQELREEVELRAAALDTHKETQRRSFQELEQQLRTEIRSLQAEKQQLSRRLEEQQVAPPHCSEEREDQRQEKQEQQQEAQSSTSDGMAVSGGLDAASPRSLDSVLQQERRSLSWELELLEEKKNEEIQTLKTALIAEQQTHFNTVLTREKLKKEQIIHELTEKLHKVTQQQDKDKALIETLSEDRACVMQEKKQLEEELNRLRSTALLSSTFFSTQPHLEAQEVGGAEGASRVERGAPPSECDADRLASVAVVTDDDQLDSAVEASMVTVHDHMMSEEKQRIILLERTLHMKEEENKRLSQRLMSQSMSSVSSRHSDKIAIRDFQVGDLVLIILDERHDNYVLFTVGPTLYFLHSESLIALDLKPASGSSRRPWVLGKVMEKEYCQAKKAQNRFKVPLGTKFYRVKAVPWNRKV